MFKKPETWKDWSLLLSAWVTALIMYGKAAWGIDLTPYVDVNFIMLTLFMGWTLYGVWKNTYVSPKAKREKEILNSYKELSSATISSGDLVINGKIVADSINKDELFYKEDINKTEIY